MRFARTEEQIAFAEATRSVLTRLCGPDAVRKAWETGQAPEAVWQGLLDVGVCTILAPESGGSEMELVAALAEVGRAAAPGPIVETAAVAVPLFAAFAPKLLDDAELLARGVSASNSTVMPYVACGSGLLLDDDRVRLVDLRGVEPRESLDDSRSVGTIPQERLSTAETLAEGPDVARHVAKARDRAALATAVLLLGLSARAVEMTVEYTGSRRQFGVPVGSFQAVKHHLANAHVAVEMARPVTEAAAWALSVEADDASRTCSMAKVLANKAARKAAKAALQCHGAIGYTMEADLHLYLMRIWSLLNAWGTTEAHLDRVEAALPGTLQIEL